MPVAGIEPATGISRARALPPGLCSADFPSYHAGPDRPEDARFPPFCRAQGARWRAPVISDARQIGTPAPRLRGAFGVLDPARPGMARRPVFTTEGRDHDRALRPHPRTAGRVAGLLLHAPRACPACRRNWRRPSPTRPNSTAHSTAPSRRFPGTEGAPDKALSSPLWLTHSALPITRRPATPGG